METEIERIRKRCANVRKAWRTTNCYGQVFTLAEYEAFMSEPGNRLNCERCPKNDDMDGRLPCGQQNCWVDIHCRDIEEG